MKKVLSSLMVMSLLCNSAFAATGTQSADHARMIAQTFDGFRYSMTVDVQPNDPAAQAKATARLKDQLEQLEANGVAPNELMDYLRNSILDSNTRADFDRLISSLDLNTLSADEAGSIAMQFMSGKYQQGANYSGAGAVNYNPVMIAAGVILVGAVTFIIVKHIKAMHQNSIPCYGNNSAE